MAKNALIDNIQRIRKAEKITQAELADIIGVSRVTYWQAERENRQLTFTEIEKIAEATDATVEEIIKIDLSPAEIQAIAARHAAKNIPKENQKMVTPAKARFFDGSQIRSVWVPEEEEWYFSVIDVIAVLTEQSTTRNAALYWAKLKQRIGEEGDIQLLTNCHQLKLKAEDGKMRLTDAANTEQLLRIIQSIPSKKAEPFKQWLARVGAERINENVDPELAMHRAVETYQKKGYDEDWIRQRLLSIKIRQELTDEWRSRGISAGTSFAILTDEISKAWSGMTTREYKDFKNLEKENLRDNMSDVELVLSMLAEASTRDISKAKHPTTFSESQTIAKEGGNVAGVARVTLEKQLGHSAITPNNAKRLNKKPTPQIES